MKYQVMPPLSPEDRAALEASIVAHGVLVPVEYDEAGEILDGHHRVEICEGLGLVDWPRFVRKGLSEPEKRTLARELNVSRRHLTTAQKQAVIADQLRDTPSISSRAIAAMLGVHHSTVQTIRRQLVDGGEISHHDEVEGRDGVRQPAHKTIRTTFLPEVENRRELIKVAKDIRADQQQARHQVRLAHLEMTAEKGRATAPVWWKGDGEGPRFPIVYADPPWKFLVHSEVTGREKSAENHYPTMDLAAILDLGCPAAKDAALFLWTADLANGLACMEAWGFTFKSFWGWEKVYPGRQTGTGYWSFDNLELLLIGTRGDFPAPLPGTQPRKLTAHPVRAHSQKPDFYPEQIERLWPGVPKIEMFCRAPRPGWEAWGFEAAGEATAPASAVVPEVASEAGERVAVPRSLFERWQALSCIDGGLTVSGPLVDALRAAGKVEADRLALTKHGRAWLAEIDRHVKAASSDDGGVLIAEDDESPAPDPTPAPSPEAGAEIPNAPASPKRKRKAVEA